MQGASPGERWEEMIPGDKSIGSDFSIEVRENEAIPKLSSEFSHPSSCPFLYSRNQTFRKN